MLAAILSVLRVDIHLVDRQDSGREQLLALFALRRDLESRASHHAARTAVAALIDAPSTRRRSQGASKPC